MVTSLKSKISCWLQPCSRLASLFGKTSSLSVQYSACYHKGPVSQSLGSDSVRLGMQTAARPTCQSWNWGSEPKRKEIRVTLNRVKMVAGARRTAALSCRDFHHHHSRLQTSPSRPEKMCSEVLLCGGKRRLGSEIRIGTKETNNLMVKHWNSLHFSKQQNQYLTHSSVLV